MAIILWKVHLHICATWEVDIVYISQQLMAKKRLSAQDMLCFLEQRWIGRLQTRCHETCQTALRFEHEHSITVITRASFKYHPLGKMLYMPKKRISTRLQYKVEDSYKKNIQRMILSPYSPAAGRPGFSPLLVRGWCRVWTSGPKARQPPYWFLSLLHQQCCQDVLPSQGKLRPNDS